tara:strand:- start:1544 stop:1699 length:156 start_codon:yes stop_codon:yes gene_type:complete
MSERINNVIQRIKELSVLLNGEVEETITLNSTGRQSKKIVIEYDVTEKCND